MKQAVSWGGMALAEPFDELLGQGENLAPIKKLLGMTKEWPLFGSRREKTSGSVSMEESIQKRSGGVCPPHVQITYDVEVGDIIVKKEPPFVMGIVMDLAGDRAVWGDLGLPPLVEYKLRIFAAVDRDNFDDIMETVALALKLSGLDRFITGDTSAAWRKGGAEPERAASFCALRFKKLDDFELECLVKSVKTPAVFFERRNLPQDLAAKLDGSDASQANL